MVRIQHFLIYISYMYGFFVSYFVFFHIWQPIAWSNQDARLPLHTFHEADSDRRNYWLGCK